MYVMADMRRIMRKVALIQAIRYKLHYRKGHPSSYPQRHPLDDIYNVAS